MSTMFTVKVDTKPEVASNEAHGGDHLPFLEASSPLHPSKLPNYTGKSWRVREGENRRGKVGEKRRGSWGREEGMFK